VLGIAADGQDPAALDLFQKVMAVQGVAISGTEQSIAMVNRAGTDLDRVSANNADIRQ